MNTTDRNEREPRWLHGHHHGQNSDRGNYSPDSHFYRGYEDSPYTQYRDDSRFNSNEDRRQMSPSGRFRPGGARYSGPDFTRGNAGAPDNPYNMSYPKRDGYNSSHHYDARADYSRRGNTDFGMNLSGEENRRYGRGEERFGHEVRRNNQDDRWGRDSRRDFKSYSQNEAGYTNYDDDYTPGFAGRNYSEDAMQYGETRRFLSRWDDRNRNTDDYDDYMRHRDRR
ncbi:hypothetical protein MKJ04_21195 [Pontibacter sp. E15-1]|uniref:hypothetical protein n=1 Tax=Pontibacter sp. E15-1 TaxID=2919918 RepID=UPI001F4F8DE1|nr:hypothetical protein [Pontibacter sp. E15-1]MCJ8167371.1 hypothetical protein [Pontibacter sp. E15-1]